MAEQSQTSSNKEASGKKRTKKRVSELVQMRNRFFYLYYRRLSLYFMLSLGICVFSIAVAVVFSGKKVPPVYIPVSEDGRLIQSFSLKEPSFPNKEIMSSNVKAFALEGIRKFYTLDYLNYTDQIFEAQPFFTVRGWNRTIKAFEESQNLNTILQQKIIVNMVPLGPPVILDERVVDGRLGWALEIPAQLKYITHDGKSQGFIQKGKFKLTILRISLVESPKGIGIDQLIFEEDTARR